MPRLLRVVLLLFFLSKAGFIPAQAIPLWHYPIKDGLPSNSITRDSKGFVWFSSNKGVSWFDVPHFNNYCTFEGLSDNDIFNIKEDYEGRLWMTTYYQYGIFHTSLNTPSLKTHNYTADKVLYKDFVSKNITGNKKPADFTHRQKERIFAKAIDKEGTVTQIEARLLFEKTLPPVPAFQTLRTSGKTDPLNSGQNITISYKEAKSIAISFENIVYAGKETDLILIPPLMTDCYLSSQWRTRSA